MSAFSRATNSLASLVKTLDAIDTQEHIAQDQLSCCETLLAELADLAETFSRKREEMVMAPDSSGEDGVRMVPRYGPMMMERVKNFERELGLAQQRWRLLMETKSTIVAARSEDGAKHPSKFEFAIPVNKNEKRVVREDRERQQQKRTEHEQEIARGAADALATVDSHTKLDLAKQEEESNKFLKFSTGIQGFTEQVQHVSLQDAKAISSILHNIVKRPENLQYRTLNLNNEAVRNLLSSDHTKCCFLALGFTPRTVESESQAEQLSYFLVEPSVESDFQAWSAWFDLLKQAEQVASKYGI